MRYIIVRSPGDNVGRSRRQGRRARGIGIESGTCSSGKADASIHSWLAGWIRPTCPDCSKLVCPSFPFPLSLHDQEGRSSKFLSKRAPFSPGARFVRFFNLALDLGQGKQAGLHRYPRITTEGLSSTSPSSASVVTTRTSSALLSDLGGSWLNPVAEGTSAPRRMWVKRSLCHRRSSPVYPTWLPIPRAV